MRNNTIYSSIQSLPLVGTQINDARYATMYIKLFFSRISNYCYLIFRCTKVWIATTALARVNIINQGSKYVRKCMANECL